MKALVQRVKYARVTINGEETRETGPGLLVLFGTDNLRNIVKRIREKITENGGEVRFLCKLEDIEVSRGRLTGIMTSEGEMPVQAVVLACGHSARDTYSMLPFALISE